MKTLLRRIVRLRRSAKGSAMLELALGAGVLVAVFTGTFQFGYTFYRYNTLESAVNAGAKYASLIPYDSATSTPSAAFSNAVKNVVVYGNPSGGTAPVSPGLTTSHVALTVIYANNVPANMMVAINGYTIDSVFGTATLTNKPSATFPYLGIYSPY